MACGQSQNWLLQRSSCRRRLCDLEQYSRCFSMGNSLDVACLARLQTDLRAALGGSPGFMVDPYDLPFGDGCPGGCGWGCKGGRVCCQLCWPVIPMAWTVQNPWSEQGGGHAVDL